MLRGEKAEERVTEGRKELVGFLRCRSGASRAGLELAVLLCGGNEGGMCETCYEGGLEGGGRPEGETGCERGEGCGRGDEGRLGRGEGAGGVVEGAGRDARGGQCAAGEEAGGEGGHGGGVLDRKSVV